jgi:trk system potassium uptake protein TrkA
MRAVFIGASSLTVMTAEILLKRGHEVVIVECNKDRIDELSKNLDCGFVHGDGTTPAIQRETDPAHSDFLFCLAANDQVNIIASLVGRSLGFPRVVTKIVNPEFEHICLELGLEETIIPAGTMGRYLADKFAGRDLLELSGMIKDEARVFSFVAGPEDEGPLEQIAIPGELRPICLYRDHAFILPEEGTEIRAEDEVVVITHQKFLAKFKARWAGKKEKNRIPLSGASDELRNEQGSSLTGQ